MAQQRSSEVRTQAPELDASLRSFYAQDSRRARSSERDLGLHWRARDGVSYRAAWVADTGELYSVRHGDHGADDRLECWRTSTRRRSRSSSPAATRCARATASAPTS